MMFSLHEAAQAIGAQLSTAAAGAPNACIVDITSDSRTMKPGELFVALEGENFDGHDYVEDVVARGAVAAMVNTGYARQHPELPLLIVSDTLLGLGALATHWRGRFSLPLIGVTGSNGKTTVKEMCAAILRAHFASQSGAADDGNDAVLATVGNLNNEIGLPTTLLRLRTHHRAAVIEMGMNHPGEIDYLTRLASPTVALVNNAQRAHLEGMGSLRQVALAKGEIFAGLGPDGVAVFNADDAHAGLWRELAGERKQITFALDDDADVKGEYLPQGFGGRLKLATPWGAFDVSLGLPGRHNARNACAAAAATLSAGASPEAVTMGLAGFTGVKGRLQRRAGLKGSLVIDDTYNANPDSMRAALDVVAGLPGRHIFVMGDMGETGESAGQFHDEIGGYAKSHGMDRLLTLGAFSGAAAHNFGEGGQHFEKLDDLVAVLRAELDEHTTVLVKGSRFMRMERVVAAISEGKQHAS